MVSTKASDPSPQLTNASWKADCISPACFRDLINHPENNSIYRDSYYGNTWSVTPALGAAVYGRTDSLPKSPVEDLGTGEYLRVPFRRVPIINVHSFDELLHLVERVESRNTDIRGVWRGQVRQYQLSRSEDDLLRLYGDASVVEPSLLPSASRENIYFPEHFEAWSGLLDLYIEQRLEALSAADPSQQERLRYEAQNFRCSYRYRLWGLATAQHYGLSSVGLDVTNSIHVALFFALHSFTTDPATGAMSMERADHSESPVIYGLGGFDKHDLLDDEHLAPAWLQCARPAAQGANFFATGWGDAGNKAAGRIYVAIRLVNHVAWLPQQTLQKIFPSTQQDSFLKFLLESRELFTEPFIQSLLKKIYFVP